MQMQYRMSPSNAQSQATGSWCHSPSQPRTPPAQARREYRPSQPLTTEALRDESNTDVAAERMMDWLRTQRSFSNQYVRVVPQDKEVIVINDSPSPDIRLGRTAVSVSTKVSPTKRKVSWGGNRDADVNEDQADICPPPVPYASRQYHTGLARAPASLFFTPRNERQVWVDLTESENVEQVIATPSPTKKRKTAQANSFPLTPNSMHQTGHGTHQVGPRTPRTRPDHVLQTPFTPILRQQSPQQPLPQQPPSQQPSPQHQLELRVGTHQALTSTMTGVEHNEARSQQPQRAQIQAQKALPSPRQVKQVSQRPRKVTQKASARIASTLPENYLFSEVPLEIREKIYRHLLVSGKAIDVLGLWTQVSRRGRRGQQEDKNENAIDIRILSVSKQAALEGSRVLYSENLFLYKLRDPDAVSCYSNFSDSGLVFKTGNTSSARVSRSRRAGPIDFGKYGHLFRHMTVELESNRTGEEYELLMSSALEALVNARAYKKSYGMRRIPPWFPTTDIRLHTLTITVSPVWEQRTARRRMVDTGDDEADDEDNVRETNNDGMYLSAIKFFHSSHRVMRAIKHIDVKFLRVNLNVLEIDEDDEEDIIIPVNDGARRHLEKEIDLRFHPQTLARNSRDYLDQNWGNDEIMKRRFLEAGLKAKNDLESLRDRAECACLALDEAVGEGWWEDHAAAELRRDALQAGMQRLLLGNAEGREGRNEGEDATYENGSDSNSIEDAAAGGTAPKTLLINMERDPITQELRANRN